MRLPTDKGANAGAKIFSLVAGMVCGAMGKVFDRLYAPSTLGSFLRTFTFGHVRQLDAVASRFLIELSSCTQVLGPPADTDTVFVDVDDTIVEVHGPKKQGTSFGYTKIRGLNALVGTITSATFAPVIGAVRLRKGAAGSARGVRKLVIELLALIRRTLIHVPARIASRARRLHLRLPTHWPWQKAWERLYTAVHTPQPVPI